MTDEQLMREALEALVKMRTSFMKLLAQVIAERMASDLTPENQADVAQGRRVIAKLEERLLTTTTPANSANWCADD